MYVCGYKWVKPTGTNKENYRNAVTMKMSTKGDIQLLDVWAATELLQRDACKAVSYDENKNEIVYMFEVTSPGLRPNYDDYYFYSGRNADALIVIMRPEGQFIKGININYSTASISLHVGQDSMFV